MGTDSHRRSHRDSRSRSRSPEARDHHHSSSHSHRERSHKSSSSRRDRDDDERDSRKVSKRRKERDESEGEEDKGPPAGVGLLEESDYFLKSSEFKVYLDEEKGKRLDMLTGDDARKYFKKFVRAWNKGRLAPKFYAGISASSIASSVSSGYSWSFSKATQRELDDASSVRKSIDLPSRGGGGSSSSTVSRPVMGPTMGPSFPSGSGSAVENLQNAREAEANSYAAARGARKDEYKKAAREGREEERDNRSTGRERVMEKRKEGNAVNREMKDAREGGGMVEVSDDVLMGGGGGSFAAMIAARDNRRPSKWAVAQEEKKAVMSDKVKEYRSKEDTTMAMFKQLAAARFGSSNP